MIFGHVVFEWRIERFEAAEAMSPATLWRIYEAYLGHATWKKKHAEK